MAELITKDDLLNKLRAYCETPDDDNIRIKNQIYRTLLSCPELLYALHRNDLEPRLFDEDGNINWDSETHEPLGEWDAYFGESGSIRPFLFIPETQTEVRHYLCYQVDSDENVRYNDSEKLLEVTFTIFVNEGDRTDQLTGLPRHDLIASIICIKGIKSESLMTLMDMNHIQINTGSACNSGVPMPSSTLQAIGIDSNDIHSCIRLSFSGNETKDELDYVCRCLKKNVDTLRIFN